MTSPMAFPARFPGRCPLCRTAIQPSPTSGVGHLVAWIEPATHGGPKRLVHETPERPCASRYYEQKRATA